MKKLLVAALLLLPAPAQAADLKADPCYRDRELETGTTAGGLYRTVAPFEHFGFDRTQVFPHTCSLRELTGSDHPKLLERTSPDTFPTPYIAATRDRDQLFVYGYGSDAASEGGFVAAVDPKTLQRRWETRIPDTKPAGQWSYPGVLLVHGNGDLYAVYGNIMVRLDAGTGEVLARAELPEDPNGTGAAYNGMVVMPDGHIVAKKIERGPCPTSVPTPGINASPGALAGLTCANLNALPSLMLVIDPDDLHVESSLVPPEPVTGRITTARLDGTDYVFAAGRDTLRRFTYAGGTLTPDDGWGPVTYRTGNQQPGTGPGVLGHFLVVQTNFLPSSEPMTITAVDLRDDRKVFTARPFGAPSLEVSKAALDTATMTAITHDFTAGQMAALHLDPERGFTTRWKKDLASLAFTALVGPAKDREIVIPDLGGGEEHVVWLDENTGEERARSSTLSRVPAPGNIVTPGFGGRFYFTTSQGALTELRPDPAHRDATQPRLRVRLTRRAVIVRLDEAARVTVRAGTRVRRRSLPAGRTRIALRARRVRVLARDAAGNPSRAARSRASAPSR